MKLKDKVIIVIGASGGIGSVLAREFHRAGATVVLSARNKDKLTELQTSLGQTRTIVCPADATNPHDVLALLEGLQQRYKLVADLVVISAGTWARLNKDNFPSQAKELAEKHFQNIFLPSFVVSFAAQQFFRQQKKGLIANISSHAAIRPELEGNLSYGPMKAGARHFMLALRHELKNDGVRVVDLQPAIVNTPDNSGLLETAANKNAAVQPEDIARWIIEHLDDPNIPAEHLFDSSVVL